MKQSLSLPIIILLVTVVGFLYYINAQLREKVIPLMNNGDILKAQTIDSLVFLSDSLRDELFIKSTTVGRYELSLEHLREVDPKAADEFENFLYKETE